MTSRTLADDRPPSTPENRAVRGLCADIGGSFIKFALVEQQGGCAMTQQVATPARDWDAFCRSLAEICRPVPPGLPVALSIAGIVDPRTGMAFSANVPCLNARPLAAALGCLLGRPVLVANDADCMVLAEARRGSGVGHHVVFGIILGSGVGGGLVIDNRILRGAGGITGEWGHGPLLGPLRFGRVEIAPLGCGCGQTGCLDTFGGAHGLERLHGQLHGQRMSSRDICAAWRDGASEASMTIMAWLDIMSGPLAVMINTTGAGIVPVAGGLGNDSALVAALDRAVRRRILRRTTEPLVVPSRFGDEAGLQGAALLLDETQVSAPHEGRDDTSRTFVTSLCSPATGLA